MRRYLATALGILLALGLALPGIAGPLPPGGTFTDDDGNIHEGYIEAIAAEEITSGCGPALYCPGDDVTRGQMASFLARALKLPAPTQDWFPDDAGLVHEDNINRIAEAGITTGFNDGTYRPFDPVRRDQMASFLARALELPPAAKDYFTDDTGLLHEDNINRIAEDGVTQGCGTGLYCPGQNVRRDQMASFIGRALDLTPMVPPPPTTTTSSTTTSTSSTTTTTMPSQTYDVGVFDSFFSPANRTINLGDSVRWTSDGTSFPHNVVFSTGGWASSGSPTTDAFTHTVEFDQAGSWVYYCEIHGSANGTGMAGTVTVNG